MKVLQFFSVMGKKMVTVITALLLSAGTWMFPSARMYAAGEPVNAVVLPGTYMEVNVTCGYRNHSGAWITGFSGKEEIITDSYTGNRLFCIEPGSLLNQGVHYPVGSMQSVYGKEKGDRMQLIAHYGTISNNDIDYLAAQCLIWEIGVGATVIQTGANAASVNAAKAVILSRVNAFFAAGKQITGTSTIYRSSGQDVITAGTVIMEKKIKCSIQKSSAQLSITSDDPSYTLKGAIYRVYEGDSTKGRFLCDLITDENGYASVNDILVNDDVSQVTFVEIQAPQGYAKDDTAITVNISSSQHAHANVTDQPVTKKVEVSVHKDSSNPSISNDNQNYDLSGAVFEAYYLTVSGDRHILGQLVTDEQGKAEAVYENIPLGVDRIFLKELASPKGYYRSEQVWQQTILQDKAVFTVADQPAYASADLSIIKEAADPVAHPAPLSGAQFTIRYYAVAPGTPLTSLEPPRTWVVETKEVDGVFLAELDPSFLVEGDSLYTDENGNYVLPLGVITITETKAPQGYILTHIVTDGNHSEILEDQGVLQLAVTMDGDHTSIVTGNHYIYAENRAEGGLSIQKSDTAMGNAPQGNAVNLSAVYQIINLNPYDVAMKINGNIVSTASFNQPFTWHIVTDANGFWSSGKNGLGRMEFLQTGRYRIEEIQAPLGYLISSDHPEKVTAMDFEITEDQQAILLLENLGDEIIRGGFRVKKQDSETGRPQGECNLKTVFTLYNRSDNPVVVNGKTVAVNGVVDVDGDGDAYFCSNENGWYESHDQLLPYGNYELVEVQAPAGYHRNEDTSVLFTISEDHQMVDLSDVIKDDVVTGRLIIYKHYNTKPSSEWDDHGEKGAVFLAVMKNALTDRFHNDVFEAYSVLSSSLDHGFSDREFSIITTDENGIGTSRDLAYGTYVIAQIKGDPDTQLIEETAEFTVSGTIEKVVDIHGMEITLYTNQKPQIVSATNDELTYQIAIVKKDAQTGKTVTLNGASFMIGYDCDQDGKWTDADRNYTGVMDHGNRIINGFVSQKVGNHMYDVFRTYSDHNDQLEPGTFVVDDGNGDESEKGTAVTPLYVSKGTYFIFEMDHDENGVKETPAGYVTAGPKQMDVNGTKFTSLDLTKTTHYQILYDENSDDRHDLTYRACIEVYNSRSLGSLTVNKSILNTIHDTSLVDLYDLSVFGFELFACQDIMDPADGTVIVKEGDHAKTLQDGTYVASGIMYPDENGVLQIDHIPLGDYVLQETVVPDGFVNTGWQKKVSFKQMENDRSCEVFAESVNLINRPTRVSVSKVSITDEKELPGASMKVTDLSGNVIDTWISGDKPHIILGLTAGGTYILHEDLAPLGYVKASSIPFTVKNTTGTQKVTMVDDIVSVFKQDAFFTGIAGAELCVEDESGTIVDRWISDGMGHHVNGLQEGKNYVLKEIQAPSGYVKARDVIFTVAKEGEIQKEIMVDKQVFFLKTDSHGNPVKGASITVKDLSGRIVDEWISDGTPHAIDHLICGGTYIISETAAPEGYVQSEDLVFTVNDDLVNQEVQMCDYRVSVNKTDEKGMPVTGAFLQVIDETGEIKDEWISDGNAHTVSYLQAGHTYVLHEAYSDSLKGYYLCSDQQIDLTHLTQDQEITVVDDTIRVVIQKVDESGNPVNGVILQLVDLDTGEQVALPDEGRIGSAPMELSGILQAGHRYRLSEIAWKQGYHPSACIEFTVPVTGSVEPVVITMVDQTTSISIVKQDDLGNPVAGAKLQIIEATVDEGNMFHPVYDENGEPKVVVTFVSEEKPKDVSAYLLGGMPYIIREISTPEGYETVMDTGFIVDGTSQVPQCIVVTDHRKTYHLEITKADRQDLHVLKGAQIGLYHPDGTVALDIHGNPCLKETDESGKIRFDVLFDPEGYDLKEVRAPSGYVQRIDPVHLSLEKESDETGLIQLTLLNDAIPETSDPLSLQTMFILLGGSLLLIAAVLYMNSDRFRR